MSVARIHLCAKAGAIALALAIGPAGAQSMLWSTPSVVTLTSSSAVSQRGDAVVLTADISAAGGGGVPAGVVRFTDITTMTTLGWTDVARPTITVTTLAAGRHEIQADYAGTAELLPTIVQPGQSAPLTHVVLAPSEVLLSSSQDEGEAGLAVTTLTARVRASEIAGAPRGTVRFRDEMGTIGPAVTLDRDGVARLATSLAGDTRLLIAFYDGDGARAPGHSPPLAALRER